MDSLKNLHGTTILSFIRIAICIPSVEIVPTGSGPSDHGTGPYNVSVIQLHKQVPFFPDQWVSWSRYPTSLQYYRDTKTAFALLAAFCCGLLIVWIPSKPIAERRHGRVVVLKVKSFSTTFARCTEFKLKTYILRQRIEVVEQQLKQSNASITTIAFSLGFPSLFSFDQTFEDKVDPSTFGMENLSE